MFTLLGLLLLIYGLTTQSDLVMYQKSFGNNINLYSGALMLVFGLMMLVPAMIRRRKH
jgi:hypothetical protein